MMLPATGDFTTLRSCESLGLRKRSRKDASSLEASCNFGCIDMTVLFDGHVYLFEFKVVKLRSRGHALKQIKERNYAQKYQGRAEPIHLIGVEFSKTTRNIVRFEVETLPIQ